MKGKAVIAEVKKRQFRCKTGAMCEKATHAVQDYSLELTSLLEWCVCKLSMHAKVTPAVPNQSELAGLNPSGTMKMYMHAKVTSAACRSSSSM